MNDLTERQEEMHKIFRKLMQVLMDCDLNQIESVEILLFSASAICLNDNMPPEYFGGIMNLATSKYKKSYDSKAKEESKSNVD